MVGQPLVVLQLAASAGPQHPSPCSPQPLPCLVPHTQAALCRIPRRRLSAAEARSGAGPLAVTSCAICLCDWRKGDDVRELKVSCKKGRLAGQAAASRWPQVVSCTELMDVGAVKWWPNCVMETAADWTPPPAPAPVHTGLSARVPHKVLRCMAVATPEVPHVPYAAVGRCRQLSNAARLLSPAERS